MWEIRKVLLQSRPKMRRFRCGKRLTQEEKGCYNTHEKQKEFRRLKTVENRIVCNCKQVSVADIEKALHTHQSFGDVDKEFEEVQRLTH